MLFYFLVEIVFAFAAGAAMVVVLFKHVSVSRCPGRSGQASSLVAGRASPVPPAAHGGLGVHVSVHQLGELLVVGAPVVQGSRSVSSRSRDVCWERRVGEKKKER